MFRRKLLLVLAVVLVLGFVSCNNGTTNDTYYVAVYLISKATYDGISTSWDATDVLAFVTPKSGTSLLISQSGYSMDEIKDFLRNLRYDESDVTSFSDRLKKGSTWDAYGTTAGGYAWLYAKKE